MRLETSMKRGRATPCVRVKMEPVSLSLASETRRVHAICTVPFVTGMYLAALASWEKWGGGTRSRYSSSIICGRREREERAAWWLVDEVHWVPGVQTVCLAWRFPQRLLAMRLLDPLACGDFPSMRCTSVVPERDRTQRRMNNDKPGGMERPD